MSTDGQAAPATAPLSSWAMLRDGGRPLAALLLFGALFKLLVMAAALQSDPLLLNPTSDARYYVERARGLAGLDDDPLLHESYHLPPLYPQLLSHFDGLLQHGEFAGVLVLQHLGGLWVVSLAYLLARRRCGRAGALLAAGLTLAYGPLTFFETRLLGDSLATALVLSVVWLAERPRRMPHALGMGLCLGLACLLRPQALLFAALLLLWLFRRRRRSAGACAAVLLALLLPSALHNRAAGGDLVLVSDNGGINLYLAATGPPSGTFSVSDPRFGSIATQAAESRRRAEAEAGRALSPGEVSRHWRDAALAAAWNDPLDQLRRVGLRAKALLENHETGIVAFPALGAVVAPPLAVAALPFAVLLGLFGAALVLLLRPGGGRARGEEGSPAREAVDDELALTSGDTARDGGAPLYPSLALAAMVVITTLAFFHYSRFRLPLVPLMAVSVGVAWERTRAGWRRRAGGRPGVSLGRGLLAAVVAAGCVCVSLLPAPHHQTDLANGWTSMAEARRAASRPGDGAALLAAHADLERALDQDPGFIRALLGSAELALARGDWEGCHAHLTRLERTHSNDGRVLAARARLSLIPAPDNGRFDGPRGRWALAQFRTLAAQDPTLAPVLADLQRLARLADERDERDERDGREGSDGTPRGAEGN